jgi:hypothetical protein
MKVATDIGEPVTSDDSANSGEILALLTKAVGGHSFTGVVTGQLVALTNEGRTPLVVFRGQPTSAAVTARSVVDLHGAHLGRGVVLLFEGADPGKPIVMGVLRDENGTHVDDHPGHVDVSADGERMLVTAKEQLVLRCGKASVTLTKAGKVLIEGTYVLSRSSGVNRVKGGSVQLN